MTDRRPLILVSNDDGIDSPGLWAAAEAVRGLGDLLVVAPCRQWSGASRCFPTNSTAVTSPYALTIGGEGVNAFCVDGSPAQVVLHAVGVSIYFSYRLLLLYFRHDANYKKGPAGQHPELLLVKA